ncbi:site-specific recombinase XerC [Opitutaceae bacterium TAV1]|nr:site-specific recombinase XerC [Opitutaceae bacterium TAV1]
MSGTLRGERVRKNFAFEVDAQAFLNKKTAGIISNAPLRPVLTTLTENEVRQHEAAAALLPPDTDIVQAATWFAQYHRPIVPIPFATAVEAYGDWLTTQRKNEEETVDARKGVLAQFGKEKKIQRSDLITVEAARAWIYEGRLGTRTQRDRFDLLNQFCGWLAKSQQKHAAANPIAELDRPVHKIDAPGVLSFAQTRHLLQCALSDPEGPDMLPFFALCVLSGVRPDEVPRLTWEDIYLEPEHMLIEVNKAKGGRSRRNAGICDPLWKILTWAKAKELEPGFFSRRKFDRIRREAGLFDLWEKDILRHTYASHHYVLNKDIKTLIQYMGNSERVLFQNYIRPVPLADAHMLFGLILHWSAPARQSGQMVRLDRLMSWPLARLDDYKLAMLRTRLAGEIAKIDRRAKRGGDATGRPALAAKLAEVTARIKR